MALDWGEMQPRRLPIYLLVATSASMQGVKIAAINDGITEIWQELMSDPRSAETVYISLITFADQVSQSPLTPMAQFVPPQLSVAGRGVSLGAALHLLNESLDRDIILNVPSGKGDYTPIVFLLMDSPPTDDWQPEAQRLRSRSTARPLHIIGLAIGDASIYVMQQVTSTVLKMQYVTPEVWRQFFTWTSQSVRAASQAHLPKQHVASPPLSPALSVDLSGTPFQPIRTSAPIQPPLSAPPPRVFVSHSHADDVFTARLVSDLRAAGIDVWVDVTDMDPGNFMTHIDDALARCDWLVLVLTPNAISSSFVRFEVSTAIGRVMKQYMRGVVPILAAPTDPQTIPPTWDGLQRYDATRDYQQALQSLLLALSRPAR